MLTHTYTVNRELFFLYVSGTQGHVDRHKYSKQRVFIYMLAIQRDMLTCTCIINREKVAYMLAIQRDMLIRIYTVNRDKF